MTDAIAAANRAADLIAIKLLVDLDSLVEQADELEAMSCSDPMTDADHAQLALFRAKIRALNPGSADTFPFCRPTPIQVA